MDKAWFKKFVMKIAEDHIDRVLESGSVTSWEIDLLKAAIESGFIKDSKGVLNLPDGRQWSLMTVNREYITHIATYCELIKSGRWKPDNIKLEHEYLDIVIFEQGFPVVAVEVKRSEVEAVKLVKGLSAVDTKNMPELDRGNDPIRKMKSLLKLQPKEFWVVSPERRWTFELHFSNGQLELRPAATNQVA